MPSKLAAHSDEAGAVLRAPQGFIDVDGVARYSSGAPLPTASDGCGKGDEQALVQHINSSNADVVTVNAPMAAITSKLSAKQFHWMVELLPQIALLLNAAASKHQTSMVSLQQPGASRQWTDAVQVLVSCKGTYVKESLGLLGVEEQRVVCFKPGRVYRTTSTLFWPQAVLCGGVRAGAAAMLRHTAIRPELRPIANAWEIEHRGKVIVHRRLTRSRALLNHERVIEVLRLQPSLRDALVELDSGSGRARGGKSTTLRSQVELFRGARCQIGPHGISLAFMLFAPSPGFGTAEVTPGAYFIVATDTSIRSVPAPPGGPGRTSLYVNRNRSRASPWASKPQPNPSFRRLAATLGMRHEWIIVPGAAADDNMAPEPNEVAAMALRVCHQ